MLAALRGDRRGNARRVPASPCAHAERAGDVVQIVRIRTNRGSHHTEEGDYHEALSELGAAIELAELVGSETFSALAYSNRGDTYMRMGRLDDALRDLRRAKGIWERLGSELVDYAVGQLGDVQALRGQRSEALALYRQAIEIAERRGDVQGLVPALIGLARVLVADDVAAAAAAAERAIEASQAVWHAPRHPRRRLGRSAPGRPRRPRPAAPPRRCGWRTPTRTARRPPRRCCSRRRIEQPPSAAHRRGGAAPVARPRQPDRRGPRRRCSSPRRAPARRATTLLATAERLLFDAGAWGYLAEARRASSARGRTLAPVGDLDARRVPRDAATARRSRSASGGRARRATSSSCSSPGAAHRSCARRWRRCCGRTSPTARRGGCRCC